jgi:HK97 family phage major capsid protein
MKRLKHLLEERSRIEGEMKAIFDKCETEQRNRTPEEKTKYADLQKQLGDLADEIKDLEAQEARDKAGAKPVAGAPNAGAAANPAPIVIEDLSVRASVAKWVESNREAITKIKEGRSKQDLQVIEVEFRAANSPMTPANTATNTITTSAIPALQNGAPMIDLLRTQPTLWDLLPKGRTSLETYPWVNKKVPAASGAADFLAPGSAKPPVSFTLEVEKSNAKKPAVSMKVATELLDDVDGMTSLITGELQYQLKAHINSILMGAAAASATDPAGIRSFAVDYTLTGVQTTNPNNWDAVRAAVAQLRAAYVEGPILVLMNPVDVANMEMSKAISQGQYLGLNLRPVGGGAFITEDYNVIVGDIMVIALDYLKTLIYKDFRIAFGWENDDFTKNLVTAIAETRFHSFHSDNHAAGFLYEQIADIKTAIAIV